MSELPEVESYPGWAVLVSAVVGLGVAFVAVWAASGFAVSSEELFRVAPTVEGGGVGTDWIVGNQMVWLDLLVALTHAADVIMGLFILFMVFLHWASFRRLAARMRRPGERREGAVATDSGQAPPAETTAVQDDADTAGAPEGGDVP